MSDEPVRYWGMEWLRLFKEGNEAAFRRFYDYYCGRAEAFLSKYQFCEQTVEDIIADAFYKLFKNRGKYESPDHVAGSFFLILRNGAADEYKEEKRFKRNIDELFWFEPDFIDPPDREMDERLALVKKLVSRLPKRMQMIVKETIYNGRTPNEVAAETGHSRQTVLNLRSKAIRNMSKAILGYVPTHRNEIFVYAKD